MATAIILDANVLLLVVVGLTNPDYISKHKRLQAFDKFDFDTVAEMIAASAGVVFNPNVLSETSNLARYTADPIKTQLANTLKVLISNTGERTIDSKIAVNREEYLRLGLTDSVLLELARSGATLLTVDLDLYLAASRSGLAAINYNHIKGQRRDFQ